MKEFILALPLHVDLPRKTKKDKRIYLNMNADRNLHFQVKNQAKVLFTEGVRPQVEGVIFTEPVILEYFCYFKDNRPRDFHNVYPIVNKYAADALQLCGVIPDDNQHWVKGVMGWYGGIDKENPRCDLLIRELNEYETKIERKIV